MKSTSALYTSFFVTVMLATAPASAAWFLKMDTVPGESMQRPGWIDVQSFSVRGISSQMLESGPRASSAALGGPDTLTMAKRVDKASPNLEKALAKGTHLPEVVIECWRAGGDKPVKYMEIKLKEVLISGVLKGGSTETIKMTYRAIEWTYSASPTPTPTHATVKPTVASAPKR